MAITNLGNSKTVTTNYGVSSDMKNRLSDAGAKADAANAERYSGSNNATADKVYTITPNPYTSTMSPSPTAGILPLSQNKSIASFSPVSASTNSHATPIIPKTTADYTSMYAPNGVTPSQQAYMDKYVTPNLTTGQAVNQPSESIQNQIDSLAAAQKAAALAGLQQSRDASLSSLGAESAKIAPQYYADRNTASTQSQLGSKNFAEFMAQRGETNSGVANQAEIASNVALQGQLGALSQQEQAANNDIARRTTDVNNAYNTGVQGSNASIQAQSIQNAINQMNADRNYNLSSLTQQQQNDLGVAGLVGNYKGQSTLAAQQLAAANAQNTFNNGISVAGLLGNYNGQSTLAAQQLAAANAQNTFQNGIAAASLTGNYNGQQTLAARQNDTQNNQWQQQFNQTNANNEFNQGITTAGLTGTYNGQQTLQGAQSQASIASSSAQTEYQRLVNANYPAEQAAKMATATAALTGANLANDYQTLVNAGYPAEQASKLAASAAQIAQGNRQLDIAQQNANKVRSSGPTASEIAAANKKDSAAATADAFQVLNNLANQGQTRDQILKFYKDHYSDFSNGNADMAALYNLIDKSFQWNG